MRTPVLCTSYESKPIKYQVIICTMNLVPELTFKEMESYLVHFQLTNGY